MKTNVISIAALALTILATGCGGGSGSGNSKGGAGVPNGRVSDIIRTSETGATFVADCQDMHLKALDRKVYIQSRFTFMPEKARDSGVALYSEQIEMYTDDSCKDSSHVATLMSAGDYGFTVDGTRSLITFKNYLFIPQRDKFAAELNAIGYCGLSGWATGVGRELSREGNCWENTKQASYLLSSLDEGKNKKIQVYNCPDANAVVPNGDCMKIKAVRAE